MRDTGAIAGRQPKAAAATPATPAASATLFAHQDRRRGHGASAGGGWATVSTGGGVGAGNGLIAARTTSAVNGLGMGIATMLALQTLLNLGGVTKAIPMTGVPLPFVSRGGSSLVTSFLALGLLLAASAVVGTGSTAKKRKK